MSNFVKISESELYDLARRAFTRGSTGFDTRDVAVEDLMSKVKTHPLNTPAEARTGLSDRDAELSKLLVAAAGGIRSTMYRVTNNRVDPMAPLEHSREVIGKALMLIAGEVNSDD